MIPPTVALLADGRRLHLQHGPIDLVIEAFGEPAEVAAAYRQAWACFPPILPRLVEELPLLRRPAGPGLAVAGPVAGRMLRAVLPHAGGFITPMAAVAGAVADEVLEALVAGRRLRRAYVNNGGDIALHLTPGTRFDIGLIAALETPVPDAIATIAHSSPVRGIATSGWGGRSFSLGIADAVTVLADDGAAADAAATPIANAVTIEHPAIRRAAASSLDPDSDLGSRLVTVAVGALGVRDIGAALDVGRRAAEKMLADGLIVAACLSLKGHYRVVGEGTAAAAVAATGAGERSIGCSRFASLS